MLARSRVSRRLRDLGVSLGVALGLFVACELTLRVVQPQTSRTEEKSGSARAVPDGVRGHRYLPGAHAIHRTPEFTAEYTIDADGNRGGTRVGDSLGVRVLVIGDSFTFGAGVAAADVWTTVMAHALRSDGLRTDLVNAGVEAYDTRSEALTLFELADRVRPDVVLLAFLANDVYTNRPLAAPVVRSADETRGEGFALHSILWAKRLAMQNDRLYCGLFLVTARKQYYATPPNQRVRDQLGITRELIAAMESFCRERGIDFVTLSIPQQFGVIVVGRGFEFRGVDPSLIDKDLSGLAQERGFPWIDTLDALARAYREDGNDLYYRVDGHLTQLGNRVLGEYAAEQVSATIAKRASR